MTRTVYATAIYRDTWAGLQPVRLVPVGRNGKAIWEGSEYAGVTCGYRAVPIARAITIATRDARFSNIEVSR